MTRRNSNDFKVVVEKRVGRGQVPVQQATKVELVINMRTAKSPA